LSSTPQARRTRAALTIAALGVVYGDIGTSPLYAVKETFSPAHGMPLTTANILGGLSSIFWVLMLVVTLKYITLVMRADNRGEGGAFALIALATSAVRDRPRLRLTALTLGLIGASLFYGDAVLTPAISVVSAVEGLEVGTSTFKPWVLPIAVVVIVVLFAVQSAGTGIMGAFFGPVCALWFLSLGAVGIYNIIQNPVVAEALNPLHAIQFLTGHGLVSFAVMGAVLLAFTGAEALYADMGHFGKWPIRAAWFGLVMPALVLNYFGQGAMLIANPEALANPFYLAYPSWALYPMVVLATAATVIASQAMISGAYALTKQAIQLGMLPRMNIVHTSSREIGQVYLPALNWLMLVAVIAVVLGFQTSSNLAAAYGVAVTGTMVMTTLLTFFVVRYRWRYNLLLCIAATAFFFVIDASFFSASLLKIREGGWFPVTLGLTVLVLMLTWIKGRELMFARLRSLAIPLETFLDSLYREPPHRVPGTAVFLTATQGTVPHALLHNLNHNKVLHERIVFLTVVIREEPWVPIEERVEIAPLGHGCFRLTLTYGYMDETDVTKALVEACPAAGLSFNIMETSFFLSREIVMPVAGGAMALWRDHLFAAMSRNAGNVVEYFNIPTNRVIELGTQIEI
jgi:KUP system potassium uptake protein